ncbi:F-box protein At1g78280 [Rhizophagus clarus]|uniref:F-box protein At1g78280 n=1 Tax=Rhizophagus clarus TaxID=94130 RepID=A0A8H3L606_9GLOM|nr:F-box protein At1g78280 [Rhizophagus clarus]
MMIAYFDRKLCPSRVLRLQFDCNLHKWILEQEAWEPFMLFQMIYFQSVFWHNYQIWIWLIKHCLDKWGDNREIMQNFLFRGTWLLTYLFPTMLSEREEKEKVWAHPLCRLLQFSEIIKHSHYLYAKWCRCNMLLINFIPTPGTSSDSQIPIENGVELTKEKFESLYDAQSVPVLIKNNGVERWKAWTDWKWENILNKYGKTVFRVANERGGKHRYLSMSLESYARYIRMQHDETPLYIFDANFADRDLEMAGAYEVPKYFQEDFFSLLSDKRPPYRWIIIGPARSGASWHVDPAGTSAWNTTIEGRKRWALYPPHVFPPGLSISRTGTNGHQSLYSTDVLENTKDSATSLFWYLEVYPQLTPEMRPLEIIQEPGQTIFIPSGWWHMVLNLDDTVAVTQNFANIHNLEHVCESLIGEKDRYKVWEAFHEKMIKAYPNLEPFITRRISIFSDHTDDKVIKEEGFSSKLDFLEGFRDLRIWQPRVIEVLRRCGLDENVPIKVISHGQNPVFRNSTAVIKFYSHLFNGVKTFYAESRAYSLITNHISEKYTRYFPKLIGSGYLFDESSERNYRWPYLVTEATADSGVSLAEVIAGGGLGPSEEVDVDGERGIVKWNEVTDFSAEILNALHSLPSISIAEESMTLDLKTAEQSSLHPFHKFISRQLSRASKVHSEWLIFSPQLISQISSYLPSSPLELYNPELDGPFAGILHDEDELTGHWTPTTIIDLGDSQLYGGDPLFDLIPIYISVLGCSKLLLKRFLEKYNNDEIGNTQKISMRMFKRRAMWYTLLWEFEGAVKYLIGCLPNIRECKNWEDVEDLVWGIV